ncbi:transglycosylase (plasmid) [Ahniella affigens]|uniref:Transglycosylase n=2 Tax=Ahniella affigens TaxID=2021234 RepID=A0A2P1PZK0_9GAMM|nr:transglycosylase [Ahniella affigens]
MALLMLLLLSLTGVSDASSGSRLSVDQCIVVVASMYEIDPLPIYLLRDVEGGWEGAVRKNDNGTEDLGPMQVNSIHLAEFGRYGISREDIRDNVACRNVFVAVSLYIRHLRASDGNAAKAIARYHSKSPAYASVYLRKIAAAIARRKQAKQALGDR